MIKREIEEAGGSGVLKGERGKERERRNVIEGGKKVWRCGNREIMTGGKRKREKDGEKEEDKEREVWRGKCVKREGK